MQVRIMVAVISVAAVIAAAPVARASCPVGKAGHLNTTPDPFIQGYHYFEWNRSVDPEFVGSGHKVVADLSMIPFNANYFISLDAPEGGGTMASLELRTDGSSAMNGVDTELSHDLQSWNSIMIIVDFSTQTARAKINGQLSPAVPLQNQADGVAGLRIFTFGSAPASGWLDEVKVLARSPSGREQALFRERFETPPSGGYPEGTITIEEPPTTELAPDVRCPTELVLRQSQTTERIRAFGTVYPPHPGARIAITLFRRHDGAFRLVDTKRPRLDPESAFSVVFSQPRTARCKLVARFAGDADTLPSVDRTIFAC